MDPVAGMKRLYEVGMPGSTNILRIGGMVNGVYQQGSRDF